MIQVRTETRKWLLNVPWDNMLRAEQREIFERKRRGELRSRSGNGTFLRRGK